MADLGEFGRARVVERAAEDGVPIEADRFRFHGEYFDLPHDISALVLMEFAHDVEQVQDTEKRAKARAAKASAIADDPARPATLRALAREDVTSANQDAQAANTQAMTAMYRYVRACVGQDAWPRFRAVALAEGVDEDELMMVCAAIYQAVAARPTRRPSASPHGPSSTGDGSTDGSVSPEDTPGPVLIGQVLQMPAPQTPAERQMAEYRSLMVPVDDAIRSSG